MKKTIKITCWTAASLLVVCAIIFHHSFLTYLAKGVLQTYSVAVWGKPLHYESLSLKDYKIVVEKPKIENETFFKRRIPQRAHTYRHRALGYYAHRRID